MFNLQGYIPRDREKDVLQSLKNNPVTAVIGPRQCGKSTLLKNSLSTLKTDWIYLDLEKPSDLSKLEDPEFFLRYNAERLICIDEIQRKPDLFPIIRSMVDETGKKGQVLLSGSASPDLLKQSSESLAGRIRYIELTPFSLSEVSSPDLWIRGGFPRSLLAGSDEESFTWREDFIRTYLERDIPQLGIGIPALQLRRFWTMCAHSSAQVLNKSKLGESLGISHTTVQRYLDIMESTFMLRVLPPFFANMKKRLIKSPKVYFRDTGILHALLNILNLNELIGHPVFGPSWETYCVEQILSVPGRWEASFFRTSAGAEIDLLLRRGEKLLGIECKASAAPTVRKYVPPLIEELGIERLLIVAPVEGSYSLRKNLRVVTLRDALEEITGF